MEHNTFFFKYHFFKMMITLRLLRLSSISVVPWRWSLKECDCWVACTHGEGQQGVLLFMGSPPVRGAFGIRCNVTWAAARGTPGKREVVLSIDHQPVVCWLRWIEEDAGPTWQTQRCCEHLPASGGTSLRSRRVRLSQSGSCSTALFSRWPTAKVSVSVPGISAETGYWTPTYWMPSC